MTMKMTDLLFATSNLRQVIEHQEAAMAKEIAALSSAQILQASLDTLLEYFEQTYRMDPPQLLEDRIEVSQREVQVDVSHDRRRFIPRERSGPFYVPGTEFTLHVPFTGDSALFGCQAATFSLNPPCGTVHGNELLLSQVRPSDGAADVKADLDRALTSVKQHLGWVERDVKAFNDTVRAKAETLVMARRKRLTESQAAAASLGYPMRMRDGAPRTYAVPDVRRKVALPPLPSGRGGALEPTLASEHYEQILQIITSMVHVIERSPAAFRQMDEEAIRQHFLVQLNGQYEGQATGETFNFQGKTDILIRAGDRNIFMAECKFWKGPKALDAAVTQLLGYASWRDTKTALLIFNRDRNLTTVLREVPVVISKRADVVREVSVDGETTFRYVLRHPDDHEREVVLTILVFDVPA